MAGAAVRWLPSLPRLRVDWRLLLLLTVVLLFPRVVALSVALVVRLVLRAVGNLFASLVKELYTQALLTSAELESQLVDWLQEQMGMAPLRCQLNCRRLAVPRRLRRHLRLPPDPPSRVGHHHPPSLQPASACTGWRGVEKDHSGYHEGGLSAGIFEPADGETFEGISMLYSIGK